MGQLLASILSLSVKVSAVDQHGRKTGSTFLTTRYTTGPVDKTKVQDGGEKR